MKEALNIQTITDIAAAHAFEPISDLWPASIVGVFLIDPGIIYVLQLFHDISEIIYLTELKVF